MDSVNNIKRPAYLWDYAIDESTFQAILAGQKKLGRLDQNWAAIRLFEYGSYADIVQLLGFSALVTGWPRWREHVRVDGRQRGIDFLVEWLPQYHPELLVDG
jgi:hypothetical protein